MLENRLKKRLLKGEFQVGTWINLIRNPSSLTLFKESGLDFVRIDMEHSGPSVETVAAFASLGRALDFPVMVRPPEANREWITRLLDLGIYNLHCPQLETPDQAIEIVKASRYFPQGLRGMGGASPANDFDISMPMKDRLKFSNDQIFITVMFESAQGLRNIDEITAIDGIDAITLGYQDLAQDLGVLGKPEQDDVLNQKRDLVIAAAKKHGKACAMMVNSVEQANHWRDQGVMLINYTSEVDILLSGYRDVLAQIRK